MVLLMESGQFLANENSKKLHFVNYRDIHVLASTIQFPPL